MSVFRFLKIIRVVGLFRLDHLLPPLKWYLKIIFFLNLWRWLPAKSGTRGQRLCDALISLGPVFVKFGQAISTRRDLFPEDIVEPLILLQDKVPPFSSSEAKTYLENLYGKPLDEVFAMF